MLLYLPLFGCFYLHPFQVWLSSCLCAHPGLIKTLTYLRLANHHSFLVPIPGLKTKGVVGTVGSLNPRCGFFVVIFTQGEKNGSRHQLTGRSGHSSSRIASIIFFSRVFAILFVLKQIFQSSVVLDHDRLPPVRSAADR